MSGNIFFCGDPHGRFDHIISAVKAHRPRAIVLLGDLELAAPLDEVLKPILEDTQIWFIHGNHDTDSYDCARFLFRSALAHRNLHRRVVEIAGIRVAGLGGIFRGSTWFPKAHTEASEMAFANLDEHIRKINDARPSRDRLSRGDFPCWDDFSFSEACLKDGKIRKAISSITPEDISRLENDCADILATHEAPVVHPYGFYGIDMAIRGAQAQRFFHGHHHDDATYENGFGVGLRSIMDESGSVIHQIGIGAVRVPDRAPPTPPGMRVRTGRFEQLRS